MKNAAQLRTQIESSLGERIPVALSPRGRVEPVRLACGIAALDELLNGGLPEGSLTEFVGERCSGRTSAAMAYVAAATRAGKVCAWIDVADALDPESAAANGVDLERLLWVRCGPRQAEAVRRVAPEDLRPAEWVGRARPAVSGGGAHPRTEGREMPQAIGAMLQAHGGLYDSQVRHERRAAAGTPAAANRPLNYRSAEREEQVDSNRMPARRGENLMLATRRLRAAPPEILHTARHPAKPWQALDQALRVADLLLQSGGFGAIVLDMGSTPPEFALRIPIATWFRFRAACERTRVSLLLLTQHPCARSSAEVVVRMHTGSMAADNTVMSGILYRAAVERSRSHAEAERVVPIRKPPQPDRTGQWTSEAAWAQAK